MRKRRAWAISQRSGLKFPYDEMIREPGTNLLIHKSESDGSYNAAVDLFTRERLRIDWGDPYTNDPARPDIDHVVDMYLQDEDYENVLDQYDNPIEVR